MVCTDKLWDEAASSSEGSKFVESVRKELDVANDVDDSTIAALYFVGFDVVRAIKNDEVKGLTSERPAIINIASKRPPPQKRAQDMGFLFANANAKQVQATKAKTQNDNNRRNSEDRRQENKAVEQNGVEDNSAKQEAKHESQKTAQNRNLHRTSRFKENKTNGQTTDEKEIIKHDKEKDATDQKQKAVKNNKNGLNHMTENKEAAESRLSISSSLASDEEPELKLDDTVKNPSRACVIS